MRNQAGVHQVERGPEVQPQGNLETILRGVGLRSAVLVAKDQLQFHPARAMISLTSTGSSSAGSTSVPLAACWAIAWRAGG